MLEASSRIPCTDAGLRDNPPERDLRRPAGGLRTGSTTGCREEGYQPAGTRCGRPPVEGRGHPSASRVSMTRRLGRTCAGAAGVPKLPVVRDELASSVSHEPSRVWGELSKTHSLTRRAHPPVDHPNPSRQGQRPRSSRLAARSAGYPFSAATGAGGAAAPEAPCELARSPVRFPGPATHTNRYGRAQMSTVPTTASTIRMVF